MQTHHFVCRSAAIHSNPKPAPCTPQLDAQHRTLPTDIPTRLDVCLITDGTPSRSLPRVLSAIPLMRDAAASKIVCSRHSRLTHTHSRSDVPPIALIAPPRVRPPIPIPMVYRHSLKGDYSDGDGTTRTGTRVSVLRDDPNATEERHLHRGRYGYREWEPPGRMRTGVIRAEKDEWGRRFHWHPMYGSTTTSWSHMSPPTVFETRTIPQWSESCAAGRSLHKPSHPVSWSSSLSALECQ
ncbi:hypothetical protein B0H14DRAFT_3559908 [Mycena olivaceomarginata]|nr:hypothetical protein B0H14DRAFT_3559908 [Mycena olivaceomarginata]